MAYDVNEMEKYIREGAIRRGIDPDDAVRVARSEGLARNTWQSNVRSNGRREPSFGPFQMLLGGPGTGFPAGMGNDYQKQTGLNPSDPANARSMVDFALDQASKGGWSPWYGAKAAGIGNMQGIGGASKGLTLTSQPAGVQALAEAGRPAAPPLSPRANVVDHPVAQVAEAPSSSPSIIDKFKSGGFKEGMKALAGSSGVGDALGLLAGAAQQPQQQDDQLMPALGLQAAEGADAGRMQAASQLMAALLAGKKKNKLGSSVPGISLMG